MLVDVPGHVAVPTVASGLTLAAVWSVGQVVGAMEVAPSGEHLAVGTLGGVLQLLPLQSGSVGMMVEVRWGSRRPTATLMLKLRLKCTCSAPIGTIAGQHR